MAAIKYCIGGVSCLMDRLTVVEVPAHVVRVRLRGMLFETDKTFLLPSAMHGIRVLKHLYDQHRGMQVLVTGHADRAGDPAYNLALSEDRARAVAGFLADQVDGWLSWYQAAQLSKRWGTREDQHMLATLPEGEPPFYAGAVDGLAGPATHAALRAFEAWSNANRGTALAVDGEATPATRRALIAAYMDLDHTTLPPDTVLETHGCGEWHPAVATADGVGLEANRRVEVFFFEDRIDPPARTPCPSGGCGEYAEWVRRTTRTIDTDTALGDLTVRIADGDGRPVAGASVHLHGPLDVDGASGPDGRASFADLLTGEYRVTARKDGFADAHGIAVVTPAGGDAPPAGAPSASHFAPEGGGGGGDDVVLVLLAKRPKIVELTVRQQPIYDPKHAHRVDPAGPRTIVEQGQKVSLEWRVEGDFDHLSVRGQASQGDLDVTAFGRSGNVTIDPRERPPGPGGVYSLVAGFQGDYSEPAHVVVIGILDFKVVAEPPAKLFAPDGSTVVVAVTGENGSFQDDDHRNRDGHFIGQVSVHPEVSYAWHVMGADHARVELEVNGDPAGKRDVTAQTRGAAGGTGAASQVVADGQHHTRTFFEADLRVFAEGSPEPVSSVIRLRQNRPYPALTDFFLAHKDGTPIPAGGTVRGWDDVDFHWKLTGDFVLNTLTLAIANDGGEQLLSDAPLAAPPINAATGSRAASSVSAPLDGQLRCTATLRPAGSSITRSVTVLAPLPPPPPPLVVRPARFRIYADLDAKPIDGFDATVELPDGTLSPRRTDGNGVIELAAKTTTDVFSLDEISLDDTDLMTVIATQIGDL